MAFFKDTVLNVAGKIPKGAKVVNGRYVQPATIREIPLFSNPTVNAILGTGLQAAGILDASRYAPALINVARGVVGYQPKAQLSRDQIMAAQAQAMSGYNGPSEIEQTVANIIDGDRGTIKPTIAPAVDYSQYPIPDVVLRSPQAGAQSTGTQTTPSTNPPKTSNGKTKSTGRRNTPTTQVGNGVSTYDSSAIAPYYSGMSKGELEGETMGAVAPDIYTGMAPAMQGNEYAQAAANGDMANAIAGQAIDNAIVNEAAKQAAQQSRYDQIMQDYALSQMADGAAVQRYVDMVPEAYGEDIGTLYDMLYGRN